jgi:hypothetical protein
MTKSRLAAGLFILTLFCFGTLQAQDRLSVSSHNNKVDTCDWNAVENGFAAGICLSADPTIIEQWQDSEDSWMVASVGEAVRGAPLHILLFAYHPVGGVKSEKLIEYEITVMDPNGDVFSELMDGKGLTAYKTNQKGLFGIGATPFSITLNDSDLSGLYPVNVLVRDAIGKTSLTLSTHFNAYRFNPLADYDFNYDFRAQREIEHKQSIAKLYEPVENISLERFASIVAGIANGDDLPSLLEKEQIRMEAWQKAEATWHERMSADSTFTLVKDYNVLYFRAGRGKFQNAAHAVAQAILTRSPLQGEPPVTFEQYIETMQAISVGTAHGHGYETIIQRFDINAYESSVVSNWWAIKLKEDESALLPKYLELSEKYRAAYEELFAGEQSVE